jgi:hypothetical protein
VFICGPPSNNVPPRNIFLSLLHVRIWASSFPAFVSIPICLSEDAEVIRRLNLLMVVLRLISKNLRESA